MSNSIDFLPVISKIKSPIYCHSPQHQDYCNTTEETCVYSLRRSSCILYLVEWPKGAELFLSAEAGGIASNQQ